MRQAARIQKVFEMKGEVYNPVDDGFVFSTHQFEAFQTREHHLQEARIAEAVHYNRKEFEAAVSKQ